jgi:hypothetical protein
LDPGHRVGTSRDAQSRQNQSSHGVSPGHGNVIRG